MVKINKITPVWTFSILAFFMTAIYSIAEEDRPPNVIFILTDDMGWGDLGVYGHPYLKTPNLDKLASEGILLEDFYVNSPVCSPSRASFMTSLYPIEVGLPHIVMKGAQAEKFGSAEYLDPSHLTYPRLFQEHGYKTGQFGKWHLGFKDTPPVKDYGFDESLTAHGNGPQFQLYEKAESDEERREFRARSTELIVDAAIDFIQRNSEAPFLVNLWTLIPHSPMTPTPEQLAEYPQLDQPRYVPHLSSRQIYYAMMTDLDRHVGRLLNRLDDLGLAENTIVIFSSDNGPEHMSINNAGYSAAGSTGPFRGVKRSLYDGGIRVPFIARWPGRIPAGEINRSDVVAGIDLMPTLAALCGISIPQSVELRGENRAPILLGGSEPRKHPVYWEWRSKIYAEPIHQSPRLALRDGEWKFLMNHDGSRIELYNLGENYAEMDNIADERPDLVERYREMLKNFATAMPQGPVQPEAGLQDLPIPPRPPIGSSK